jgi:hypothetical protein
MNPLLAHYGVAVHHPEVSGAEHLELLQIRDQLAGLEPLLTAEELDKARQNILYTSAEINRPYSVPPLPPEEPLG